MRRVRPGSLLAWRRGAGLRGRASRPWRSQLPVVSARHDPPHPNWCARLITSNCGPRSIRCVVERDPESLRQHAHHVQRRGEERALFKRVAAEEVPVGREEPGVRVRVGDPGAYTVRDPDLRDEGPAVRTAVGQRRTPSTALIALALNSRPSGTDTSQQPHRSPGPARSWRRMQVRT